MPVVPTISSIIEHSQDALDGLDVDSFVANFMGDEALAKLHMQEDAAALDVAMAEARGVKLVPNLPILRPTAPQIHPPLSSQFANDDEWRAREVMSLRALHSHSASPSGGGDGGASANRPLLTADALNAIPSDVRRFVEHEHHAEWARWTWEKRLAVCQERLNTWTARSANTHDSWERHAGPGGLPPTPAGSTRRQHRRRALDDAISLLARSGVTVSARTPTDPQVRSRLPEHGVGNG